MYFFFQIYPSINKTDLLLSSIRSFEFFQIQNISTNLLMEVVSAPVFTVQMALVIKWPLIDQIRSKLNNMSVRWVPWSRRAEGITYSLLSVCFTNTHHLFKHQPLHSHTDHKSREAFITPSILSSTSEWCCGQEPVGSKQVKLLWQIYHHRDLVWR